MYKKGKVHPSPPLAGDPLSLLPVTILALAAALSADDKQILAYLISCSSRNTNPDAHRKRAQKKTTVDYHAENGGRGGSGGGGAEHEPVFECDCFNCYLSYWTRWDNSPNRQVIDEIIEAYEEWLLKKEKKSSKKKKEKEKKEKVKRELKGNPEGDFEEVKVDKGFEIGKFELVENDSTSATEDVDLELEKSTVRKISSFVGQKLWGFWGK